MKSLEAKLLRIIPTKDAGTAGSDALRGEKVRGKRPTNPYSLVYLIASSVPAVRPRSQSSVEPRLGAQPS